MVSQQSGCRPSHRPPLPRVVPARGSQTSPSRPEVDQVVAFSTFLFFAASRFHTVMIDARSASTACVSWAIVMHSGGITTRKFRIGPVRRTWLRDRIQNFEAKLCYPVYFDYAIYISAIKTYIL